MVHGEGDGPLGVGPPRLGSLARPGRTLGVPGIEAGGVSSLPRSDLSSLFGLAGGPEGAGRLRPRALPSDAGPPKVRVCVPDRGSNDVKMVCTMPDGQKVELTVRKDVPS